MEDELRNRKTSLHSPNFTERDPRLIEKEFNIATYPYKSSFEYATAVNQWLWQCYNWQCMTITLPYLMTQTAYRTQTLNADGTIDFNRNIPSTYFPNQNLFVHRRSHVAFQGNSSTATLQGTQFIIPSLLKRFTAEVIDFCILLVLKVLITYIAVDFFDLVSFDFEDYQASPSWARYRTVLISREYLENQRNRNLDKYDLDLIKNDKLDYHRAMEVTSEILALEIAHRFVVCIFEALCIYKGVFGNGGATPGKTLMRLRVVSCQSVVPVDSNTVRVYPAGDLGIGWAFLRAFIKNFSLAFIFPIFFTMYFFQHNRTAYDIICNSIVVEEMPRNRHL